ncbi:MULTISPECIES: hypothetical protein [unclassified Coleofasciculus]|uniref:hypothetical protein n=1 Tax=unclassified Coleofasciculus TaxID=2692782 RepID=UPI00187FBD80|nr:MULTISPECIES: hypothetical protein [unclassified Coleofasciculus]MBE9130111.1 hypothetical protein [Coleofasciculus sp. LEGE 07081]MBE9147101.1 hypothetical protein [Coleofasciculus sp. LEGE 07092]
MSILHKLKDKGLAVHLPQEAYAQVHLENREILIETGCRRWKYRLNLTNVPFEKGLTHVSNY